MWRSLVVELPPRGSVEPVLTGVGAVRADGGETNARPGQVIDLADHIRRRAEGKARQRPDTVAYSLFLLVSRARDVRQHSLFYLFLEGAPTMVAAAGFARAQADVLGDDISLVDLHEQFGDAMEVMEVARLLKDAAPGATILAPGLGLGPRLVGNG